MGTTGLKHAEQRYPPKSLMSIGPIFRPQALKVGIVYVPGALPAGSDHNTIACDNSLLFLGNPTSGLQELERKNG